MAKPGPKDLLLSSSLLTWPWAEYADPEEGERKVREYLDSFKVENGRVVLMAKGEMYKYVHPEEAKWEAEPWYGTLFRVERFDDEFVKEVCLAISKPRGSS
jgi:insulysin